MSCAFMGRGFGMTGSLHLWFGCKILILKGIMTTIFLFNTRRLINAW